MFQAPPETVNGRWSVRPPSDSGHKEWPRGGYNHVPDENILGGRSVRLICIYSAKITAMKTFTARFVAFVLVLIFSLVTRLGNLRRGRWRRRRRYGWRRRRNTAAYPVPWKLPDPKAAPVTSGLILYWFPASANEIKMSSLREYRATCRPMRRNA